MWIDSEVLCQIDNLHVGGNCMFLEEGLALAMAKAEEYNVHLVEGHLARKLHFRIAKQAFVYVVHFVACIALAIGKNNLNLGVIDKQSYQLAARITSSAKYSYSYHFLILLNYFLAVLDVNLTMQRACDLATREVEHAAFNGEINLRTIDSGGELTVALTYVDGVV